MADIVERLRARAQTMNGALPVGSGDGNTYLPAHYDRNAQSDDIEAAERIEAQARQITDLRAQLDEARKALKPFALVAPVFDKAVKPAPRSDEHEVYAWETMAGHASITVGDFRRAAAIRQRGDGE